MPQWEVHPDSIDHVPLCSVESAISWQVIGGSGTGGILVRQGQDWSWDACCSSFFVVKNLDASAIPNVLDGLTGSSR